MPYKDSIMSQWICVKPLTLFNVISEPHPFRKGCYSTIGHTQVVIEQRENSSIEVRRYRTPVAKHELSQVGWINVT